MENLDRLKQIGKARFDIYQSGIQIFIVLIVVVFLLFFSWFFISFIVNVCKARKTVVKKIIPYTPSERYVHMYIEQIKGYKKIIYISNYSFLLISEYGLFFCYITEEVGLLEGNYTDLYLSKKGEKAPVPNPFIQFNHEYQKVSMISSIQKVLLTKNTCYLQVKDYKDETVIKEKNIIPYLEKKMGPKKIYTSREVDVFYEQYAVKFCQSEENLLQSK